MPLSTLHTRPYGRPYMTRGRCDWLSLHRATLSFATPHRFIPALLPYLSMPKRGPKCKLGYHRVFNLILWVLYTGMQWKCLPIPTDTEGKPAIHYTTVYKVFAKWVDDGSLWQA